ncbi:MAG: calcineurin-like phosphoesterase family protein [Bacteroidota bacterium]
MPTRRAFIRRAGLAAAGVALLPSHLFAGAPVRIRGRVVDERGRGVGGVAISDGLQVIATEQNGRYELISTNRRSFVFMTVPAGFELPTNEAGSALFYLPIRPDEDGEMDDADFELTSLEEVDIRHSFLALADPQMQNAFEMERFLSTTVPDLAETVQASAAPVAFGVSCGDIMFDDLTLYPDYIAGVAQTGVPFYQVVGNHDLNFEGVTDETSTRTFQEFFGPTYYSFERGAIHYIVLDNVFWTNDGYLGYLDDVQLTWLEADLARVAPGRTVVVLQHIPTLSSQYRRRGESGPSMRGSVANRARFYELLSPYTAHVISGHTHENEHVFEGGVHEHILGAVCGPWWAGPICHDGTPAGYAVYEARGSELRWRYKATGQPDDLRLRTYARGTDPTAPTEIIANVWDWDPAWTVIWYEDGQRRGEMARRTGLDPLSIEQHTGPNLPERRTWVEPMPNDHMFYAPVGEVHGSLRVEVIDRWGRTFTEQVG